MTHKGYTARMKFDGIDKIIIGRVEGLDDIITFHAASVAEFETRFHATVDDYLAACQALGTAPEKPASGKLMLRIEPKVHVAVLRAAAQNKISLNKWAEKVLAQAAG